METLHLTLKKKWFNLVLSGEKKEEYREVKKHWIQRLISLTFSKMNSDNELELILKNKEYYSINRMNAFKIVEFTNGYGKESPKIIIECLGIEIGKGRKEWGSEPDTDYFIIKLGKILSTSNC